MAFYLFVLMLLNADIQIFIVIFNDTLQGCKLFVHLKKDQNKHATRSFIKAYSIFNS